MRGPEASIEDKVVARAHAELGVYGLKLSLVGDTGWPDRQFFIPGGRPLFIEFKAPGEKPEPRQVYIRKFLTNHGYDIQTHTTEEGALQAIQAALEAARLHAQSRKVRR